MKPRFSAERTRRVQHGTDEKDESFSAMNDRVIMFSTDLRTATCHAFDLFRQIAKGKDDTGHGGPADTDRLSEEAGGAAEPQSVTRQAGDGATLRTKNRGRPKEYSEKHKANCEKHFQEWRTFYEQWKSNGQKGSARRAFAKSKNMKQRESDTMIRYGAPQRKTSRRKTRRKSPL
jgi:hypothetical protein